MPTGVFIRTEETRKKVSESLKRVVRTPDHCKHISESKKGERHPLFGKHIPDDTRRKMSESHKGKFAGEKSWFWKGGLSFEPYCIKFNNEFRERVRAFFGYRCVECGVLQSVKKLSVHHVNFRKDSCCSPDAPRLFVPLCKSCHSKTNHRREYWEHHFTEMITEKYDGKCYEMKMYEV